MLRQIIETSGTSLTINLPFDMVGKTVEVIAFEIDEETDNKKLFAENDKAERLAAIRAITKNSLVDLSNFKFNRYEANDYRD